MSDQLKELLHTVGIHLPFRTEGDADNFHAAVDDAFPGNEDDAADNADVPSVETEPENKGAVKTPASAKK